MVACCLNCIQINKMIFMTAAYVVFFTFYGAACCLNGIQINKMIFMMAAYVFYGASSFPLYGHKVS